MKKKLLEEIKKKLKKEKEKLETDLKSFAVKDKSLEGDWDTKFPKTDGGVGSQALEDAADQVEKYATLLSIEHSLETRLLKVNKALGKIKKGTYPECDKCGKKIEEKRLRDYPEAALCKKCSKSS